MSAISSATQSLDLARAILETASLAISEGVITPEIVSAQEQAEVQIEAQTRVLKEALAAEAQILDLLV
jgi:hypothetical protein